MNAQVETEKKNIVLLGLGYAHLQLVKRLSEQKSLPFEVTLVTEHTSVPLRTMIPDFIAGFCKRASVLINSDALLQKSKVNVIQEPAVEIDTKKNRVKLRNGQYVRYDFLSINCGARPNSASIKGAQKFAFFNKPIRDYQQAIMDFCDSLRGRKKVTIVQVGSENCGLESVLSLIRRLKAYSTEPSVHLIEAADRLMPNHPRKVSSEMMKIAEECHINVYLEAEVEEVGEGSVKLSNGTEISSDFTSIALPTEAVQWLKSSGLKLHNGLLKVNHHLQTSEHNVFAVGSVAIDSERPWPRSHLAAEKQAKVLFQNIKGSVAGTPLKKYRPSATEVEFVVDGDGQALMARGGLVFKRRPMFWNWKVKRDQKFQNMFNQIKSQKKDPSVPTKPESTAQQEPQAQAASSNL